MVGGYAGKFLDVDLTNRSISTTRLNEEEVKKYIGGRTLGCKFLWDRVPRGTDPLCPDNLLLLMAGPLAGIWTSIYVAIFKSPLTELIGKSCSSGHFGAEIKYAGYDGIVFSGKADSPVYLYVKDDNVELRDAKHLWGKTTSETIVKVKKECQGGIMGEKNRFQVSCIGPAGENRVRYASLHHRYFGAASRCGGGAVMGSKNLKAVAVRGTKGAPPLARQEECLLLLDKMKKEVMRTPNFYTHGKRWGMYSVLIGTYGGIQNLRNCQSNPDWVDQQSDIQKLNITTWEMRNHVMDAGCTSCPMGCGAFHPQMYVIKSGAYAGTFVSPKSDNGGSLCTPLGVYDTYGHLYLVSLADELGMDAEQLGGEIPFAMECYEKGILTKEDFGGLELAWGNVQAAAKLMVKIANREGIGNVLAEGLKFAPKIIGKGSEKYAMGVKGLAFGQKSPRTPRQGFTVALSHRGGCHKGPFLWRNWMDSLGVCYGPPLGHTLGYPNLVIDLFNAATGWDLIKTKKDYELLTERMYTLERAYCIREGMIPWSNDPMIGDVLPDRLHEPLSYRMGTKTCNLLYPKAKFLEDRAKWYESRGCDERGVPKKETLEKLDLNFVIPIFKEMGIWE